MSNQDSWLKQAHEIASKDTRLVLGLMSGTSMDAIDVAICEISGTGLHSVTKPGAKVKLKHFDSIPYAGDTRVRLQGLGDASVRDIAELNILIGEAFASAALRTLDSVGLSKSDLDLVGSHGQTIYHHSRKEGAHRCTLQVGDGDVIAERLQSLTVFDFRARDIAAGGEGAPLSPYGDAVLFQKSSELEAGRVVLNLGGIANFTVLDQDPSKIIGFDTGPANSPIDRVTRIITKGQKAFDSDGSIARTGKVDTELLKKLLNEDPFLKLSPPKSTGFEAYGDAFVAALGKSYGCYDENLLATVVDFVAESIAFSLREYVSAPIGELVVAGGGSRNEFLLERLAAVLAPLKVIKSEDLGVPGDAREAMIFALLANEALFGTPAALPSVTGVEGARVLGKIAL